LQTDHVDLFPSSLMRLSARKELKNNVKEEQTIVLQTLFYRLWLTLRRVLQREKLNSFLLESVE